TSNWQAQVPSYQSNSNLNNQKILHSMWRSARRFDRGLGPTSFTAGGPNLSRPTKDQANLYFAPSSPNAYSNSWSGLVSNTGTLFKSPGTVLRSKSSARILLLKSLGDNGNETGAPASGLRENGAAIVFCRPFWK